MTRRFEHPDGRFWEVDTSTAGVVVVRWGSPSKPTQRVDREASWVTQIDKHVAQQIEKGYVEVAQKTAEAPPPESRQSRFEWRVGDVQWMRDILLVGTKVHDRTSAIEGGRNYIHNIDTQHALTLVDANVLFDQLCTDARTKAEEIDLRQRAVEAVAAKKMPQRDLQLRKSEPSYSELESQCLESPDEEGPWIVYADFLESKEDPRGVIAARARAGQAVNQSILEQLAGIADEDDVEPDEIGQSDHEVQLEFGLQFGFVRHAKIVNTYDSMIALDIITRRFLARPISRFVDSLRFGVSDYEGRNNWAPTVRAIVESAQAKSMRALSFNAFTSEDQEISWVAYGDWTGLLVELPMLEDLCIRSGAGGTLGDLPPSLKRLTRESGGLARAEIAHILAAELPNLEHLELWTGSNNYNAECTLSDLERVLEARDLPRLRHLGIVNSELVDALIPTLATSRILPQLHSLDLSRGIAASEASGSLVQHAAAFRHLASIDLSASLLSEEQCERIRSVLDNVIVGDQRQQYDNDRYVSLGE